MRALIKREFFGYVIKNPKRKLLKEIDQAMPDPNRRCELEREIVKGIAKDFKPRFRGRRDEFQSQKRDLEQTKLAK
jgi:hypothetical protein